MATVSAEMKREAMENSGALGVYLQEMWHDLLTKDEEEYYGYRVSFAGDWQARNYLVSMNLRLVLKIAFQYAPFMPKDDLIQEGNIGLMRAADKFNPTFGCRFSTYAVNWIRAHVLDAITDESPIKIPQELRQSVRKMAALEKIMLQEHGRPPTQEEAIGHGIPKKHWEKIQRKDFLVVSLDAEFSDDSEGSLLDVLFDESDEGNATKAIEDRDHIEKLLLRLSKDTRIEDEEIRRRMYAIVARAFGVLGFPGESTDEIASTLGLKTHEVNTLLRQAKNFMGSHYEGLHSPNARSSFGA